jgi:hypothetical protein
VRALAGSPGRRPPLRLLVAAVGGTHSMVVGPPMHCPRRAASHPASWPPNSLPTDNNKFSVQTELPLCIPRCLT